MTDNATALTYTNDGTPITTDSVVAHMVVVLEDQISKYSTLRTDLDAAKAASREKERREWLRTTEHEEVTRLREAIEKARARMNELALEEYPDDTSSEEERDRLKTELKETRKNIRSTLSVVEDTMKGDKQYDVIQQKLQELGDPTRASEQSGKGTGQKRPRVNIYVTGGSFTYEHFPTFSAFAQKAKGNVDDLQAAFYEAAGEDEGKKSPVDFGVSVNNVLYHVHTEPKPVQRKGSTGAGGDADASGDDSGDADDSGDSGDSGDDGDL